MDEIKGKKVFVVSWHDFDIGESGIIGVYSNEAEANSTRDMLDEHSGDDRHFSVQEFGIK